MSQPHNTIRVILVDDDQAIHDEIGALLRVLDGIELVAEAFNGVEGVSLCDAHYPHVVLMDVRMPVMNGIEATKIIKSRHPEVKILVLSGVGDDDVIREMLSSGAVGYLLKYAQPEDIEATIRSTYHGGAVFSEDVTHTLVDSPVSSSSKTPYDYGLTMREMEVLIAMSEGLNNSEVARKLYISTPTVRFHLSNIISKLGAKSRTEALIIAARENLI